MAVKMRNFVFVLLATAVAAGCFDLPTDSEPEPPAPTPWVEQFTFGNSRINSVAVVTHQEHVERNYLRDYVLEENIPWADLRVFVTHVYVPTAEELNTQLSGISVVASRTNGTNTGNIYDGGEFVERTTLEGQLYDVYRLEGVFRGDTPIRPGNLDTFVFSFRLEYLDGDDVLDTSNKVIEIRAEH